MDTISELPDALLLKILSLLPTKDVVTTMVLSKRWQPLWMMVPRLVYDDSYQNIEYGRFSLFVDRALLLHEAPVLETVHFKLGQKSGAVDIGVWIRTLVKRSVRELIIKITGSSKKTPAILPRSLFMGCRMLVTLKLCKAVLGDVTSPLSFPSLKKLSLISMTYPADEFVNRLLSNCPVLEDLVVKQKRGNVINLTVKVPSLKSLVLHKLVEGGVVIDAPSLEYLDLQDYSDGFCLIENEMPNLVKAVVVFFSNHPRNILSSITSVEYLYLYYPSAKDVYPLGSVFRRLIHLKISTCETEWVNLLMCLLRDSPKLQSLKLEKSQNHEIPELAPCWTKPSSVPECLLSSLETFEWVNYQGTKEEKEVVAFILRSGSCLKNVTIFPKSTDRDQKLEMVKELTLLPRCLFMGCRMLVTLKLREAVLVDVTCPFSFPSLKKLSLISLKYPDDKFVNRLLSNCPVLEDLVLEQCEDDNVINLTIKVPSLKSLVLHKLVEDGFVIDAPSLEYLDLQDYSDGFSLIENQLLNLVEANVVVLYNHPGNILSSITSVKRLYLCLAKDVYPLGCVFHRLIHLTICTCETEWLNLLMCLLRDSPKLQSLKLEECQEHEIAELAPCWIKPSSVPECLLSSLETFEWVKYKGTKEEKEVVAFILRSGSCLKNVTIFSKSTDRDEKLEMVKELTLLPRRSPTCQFAFR